jgi:hypothetical protein
LKLRKWPVLILMLFPCILQAEVLFLKDGSNLVGKLLRVEGDTLYFQPTFGGTLKFNKSDVRRIQFDDSEEGVGSRAGIDRYATPVMNEAEPGSLIVSFDGISVSNKITIHRMRNYEELERANWIQSSLIVEGREVASVIDSTIDKVYREGPDTYLKNTMNLPDFRVELESGTYSCLIVIKNIGASEHNKAFEYAPLDLSLNVDNITIYPQRNSTIEIGKKRGTFKLGMPKLYVKTYR